MSGRQRLWGHRCPPVSLRPGRAHPPPSSHTSTRVHPRARPAPQGARGAHGGCLPHGRAGSTPHRLPWDRGALLFLLCEGERLHRVSPASQRHMDVPSLITQGRGKGGQESPRTANPPVTRDTRRSRVGKHGWGGAGMRNGRLAALQGMCQDPWGGECGPALVPRPVAPSSPPHGSPQPPGTYGHMHSPRVPAPCALPCPAAGRRGPACAPSPPPQPPS